MVPSKILFSFFCFIILFSFIINPSYAGPIENSEDAQPSGCGAGTTLDTVEGKVVCVPDPIDQEILLIIIGLVITAVVSGVGFIFTAVETKNARNERNLSMVGGFTSQISSLKDTERNLSTKKDCEVYAQNFIDLMDQIAYLTLKKTIPEIVTKFFENDFAYALTMIIWLKVNEENIRTKNTEEQKSSIQQSTNELENLYDKEKGNEYLRSRRLDDKDDTEFTWSSLIELCNNTELNPPRGISHLKKDELPDVMINDYKDLPDEAIDAAIDLVKGYSEQISSMKEKERNLKTKKDCEVYALNYVDLMDQIAFLYLKNMFPSDLSKYFENEFAYALTMIKWLNNNEIISDSKDKIGDSKDDWKNYFDSLRLDDADETEFTWSSLLGWCREGKKCIQPLNDKDLPPIMKEDYTQLPDESVDSSLEIIKDYGERLSLITEKEKDFGDKDYLNCELHANSYLDLVDGIAFLYRQKVIPEKIAEYFENNFCYALTLYSWLLKQKLANPIKICKIKDRDKKDRKTEEPKKLDEWLKLTDSKIWEVDKDFTWTDLMTWCKSHNLTPFENDQLPPKMRNMKVPPENWLDRYQQKKTKNNNTKKKDSKKGSKKKTP